jgi:phosphopentomutase
LAIFLTIVLDGVGIGAQPDAHLYGDEDSHTLGNLLRITTPSLPNLEALGLGCITSLDGLTCPTDPAASYGKMEEFSPGKDSTTGHWELAGLRLDRPFPTYPNGFPQDVVNKFKKLANLEGVLGNYASSGTEVIAALGEEHQRTGHPILYTSADSVFQVAAHVDTIPLDDLYDMCELARSRVCVEEHAVGRVIARPFTGDPGSYTRISAKRRDFSLLPSAETLQEALQSHRVTTVSIGKVADLFGGVGFTRVVKTRENDEGMTAILAEFHAYDGRDTFVWANLVDFDQEFGHRNDPPGFARALEQFDAFLPRLLEAIPNDGCALITADHGTDPTTVSTDHSREYVPVLLIDRQPSRDLGTRSTFNDHAATVAAFFDIPFPRTGTSMLRVLDSRQD